MTNKKGNSNKGFVFLPVAVFVGFALIAGVVFYKKYISESSQVQTSTVPPTTSPIEAPDLSPTPTSATPTTTSTPTPKPANKPVTKTPTSSVTGLTTDCSKFDKTKKATLTIHVTGKRSFASGWIAWLKPGGQCPGETPGNVTLSYNASGTISTYTFPEVTPGQFRLDVFDEGSIGITLDLYPGSTTKEVIIDE